MHMHPTNPDRWMKTVAWLVCVLVEIVRSALDPGRIF
jgi:hypothetical protein